MRANALVMSRNQSSVRLLVAAFAELGIEYRIALSGAEAIDILRADHHSALIVDFDLPQSAQIAKATRSMPAKRRPVLFGMLGEGTSIADVFQAGANFVLYKPLDLLQVLHSFRAAEGFMQSDRRNSSRQKNETLAYLELPTGTVPALVQDFNEQGISIQAAEELVPMRGVRLRFLLPRTTQVVHATGNFVWADDNGRAGLFFNDMPSACRRDLRAWLKKHGGKNSNSVRAVLEQKKPRRVFAAVAQ